MEIIEEERQKSFFPLFFFLKLGWISPKCGYYINKISGGHIFRGPSLGTFFHTLHVPLLFLFLLHFHVSQFSLSSSFLLFLLVVQPNGDKHIDHNFFAFTNLFICSSCAFLSFSLFLLLLMVLLFLSFSSLLWVWVCGLRFFLVFHFSCFFFFNNKNNKNKTQKGKKGSLSSSLISHVDFFVFIIGGMKKHFQTQLQHMTDHHRHKIIICKIFHTPPHIHEQVEFAWILALLWDWLWGVSALDQKMNIQVLLCPYIHHISLCSSNFSKHIQKMIKAHTHTMLSCDKWEVTSETHKSWFLLHFLVCSLNDSHCLNVKIGSFFNSIRFLGFRTGFLNSFWWTGWDMPFHFSHQKKGKGLSSLISLTFNVKFLQLIKCFAPFWYHPWIFFWALI